MDLMAALSLGLDSSKAQGKKVSGLVDGLNPELFGQLVSSYKSFLEQSDSLHDIEGESLSTEDLVAFLEQQNILPENTDLETWQSDDEAKAFAEIFLAHLKALEAKEAGTVEVDEFGNDLPALSSQLPVSLPGNVATDEKQVTVVALGEGGKLLDNLPVSGERGDGESSDEHLVSVLKAQNGSKQETTRNSRQADSNKLLNASQVDEKAIDGVATITADDNDSQIETINKVSQEAQFKLSQGERNGDSLTLKSTDPEFSASTKKSFDDSLSTKELLAKLALDSQKASGEKTPTNISEKQAINSSGQAWLNQLVANTKNQVETSRSSISKTPAETAKVEQSVVTTLPSFDGVGEASRAKVLPAERMSLNFPQQTPQWANDLSSKVSVLVKGQLREAQIVIEPPELGPVNIKLTLNKQEAQIHFQASHTMTRDAIEFSLPRLKDMLESQGIQLTDANVSDQRDDQAAENQGEFAENGSSNERQSADSFEEELVLPEIQHHTQLDLVQGIDYFA